MQFIEDFDKSPFGESYADFSGGIVQVGPSLFNHYFGGTSWLISDSEPIYGGPALLFSFDLSDPFFYLLRGRGLSTLPICTYTLGGLWIRPQIFQIYPKENRVLLVSRVKPELEDYSEELYPPFPEKQIRIEPMCQSDCPITEDDYWRISDEFVGGARFIRVLGPPLWLQYHPIKVICDCGQQMMYVFSLGYENPKANGEFLPKAPLFLGEAGLYWFLCLPCLKLATVSQST